MVAIDKASEVSDAYFLFTADPLTVAVLDNYSGNLAAYVATGKLQLFHPNKWLTGDTTQPHSILPNTINRVMAEMIAEQKHASPEGQLLAKALGNTLHPPLADEGGNELDWLKKSGYFSLDGNGLLSTNLPLPPQTRFGKLQTFLNKQQGQGAAFVLHDPIGINQELNNFRNASFDRVEEFMAQSNKGITNLRKFNVAQSLEDVQFGLENAIIGKAEKRIDMINAPLTDYSDIQYPAGIVTPAERAQYQQKVIEFRQREYKPSAEKDMAKIRAEAAEKAKKSFNKYANLLNIKERDDFLGVVATLTQACSAEAEKRAPDHLKWLSAPLFMGALDAYDKKNIGSGLAFEYQATLCTLGIEGCAAYHALLLEWASSTVIKPENLLYRTHIRNQIELQTAAEKALAEAKVLVATVATWTAAQKAFKTMADLFKKADGLIEEFNKNKGALPGFGKAGTSAVAMRYSQWGQVLFKFGIGNKADQALVAMLGGFLYSSTGNLASRLRLDELQKAFDAKGAILTASTAATISGVQQDAVRESIDASLKQGPTGKFYQVRVGVIMGLLEAWNLYNKASKYDDKNMRTKFEAVAGALALTAATIEIAYAGAKLIKENASTESAAAAGNLVRGGLKFTGAIFGAAAGMIGSAVDFMEMRTTFRKGEMGNFILSFAYGIRGALQLAGSGLSLVVGASYTGAILERWGFVKLATWAKDFETARAIWLLRVGKFTIYTVIITIGIEVLLLYIPNKLEKWCTKCTFRKNKNDTPYENQSDELTELQTAFYKAV